VRIFTVARPRSFANRLLNALAGRREPLLETARKTTSPASVSSKATADPAWIPSRSRTFLGIVTWPLDVTLFAIK
jgi:hypothetical protein